MCWSYDTEAGHGMRLMTRHDDLVVVLVLVPASEKSSSACVAKQNGGRLARDQVQSAVRTDACCPRPRPSPPAAGSRPRTTRTRRRRPGATPGRPRRRPRMPCAAATPRASCRPRPRRRSGVQYPRQVPNVQARARRRCEVGLALPDVAARLPGLETASDHARLTSKTQHALERRHSFSSRSSRFHTRATHDMALLRALLLASVVALGASRSNPAVEVLTALEEEGAAQAARLLQLGRGGLVHRGVTARDAPDLIVACAHGARSHARRPRRRRRAARAAVCGGPHRRLENLPIRSLCRGASRRATPLTKSTIDPSD